MSSPEPFSRFRPHPWHGLSVGPNPPEVVHAYIEITPFDRVKYEIDKETGYLRVDRPHRASSVPPNLYGFIPKTFCGKRVAALSDNTDKADGDPLDICVISERPISQPEVILNAKVVGGLQMIDHGLVEPFAADLQSFGEGDLIAVEHEDRGAGSSDLDDGPRQVPPWQRLGA